MSKRPRNIKNISLSDFYCTKCGNKGIPIFRIVGQERESGHLKKLFCLNCQEEVNMVEIRPTSRYNLENFWLEYNFGNFDENGNRKESWKRFCAEKRNEI